MLQAKKCKMASEWNKSVKIVRYEDSLDGHCKSQQDGKGRNATKRALFEEYVEILSMVCLVNVPKKKRYAFTTTVLHVCDKYHSKTCCTKLKRETLENWANCNVGK